MNEKPVNLHFFIKSHADNFAKVCFQQQVIHNIRHDPEGYYVKTDPLTPEARRRLVSAWAKVTINEERQCKI